jgi:replicative DNA helicase
MNLDRVSPHDLDAERAILGAILVNNDRLHDIGERVKPADFYRAAHQKLFEVMRGLSERGEAIDFVTVKSALGAALDEIGGPLYIAKLGDGLMSSSNIGEYCRIVKDKSIRRRLQAAADQAVADASNAELEASSALERAEVAIYEIAEREQRGDLLPSSIVVAEADPILEAISDSGRPITGVSTGFTDLDSKMRGFQPGNLILVAGRPGTGKTALALNIAQYASTVDDVKTAVFSLEMSRTELMIRLLTAAARVDSHRLMRGFCNEGELLRIGSAKAEIAAASLWIDDTSTMTVSSIRGKARRMKARQGQGLGLVIIDYLQLLASERRYDSRVVEVGAMSRALKQLAKELAVPVVCLAQLNRASEARGDGRPKLSDLRESGSLEQDADVVLLLYRAAEYSKEADPNEAEIIIAKSRNGPTGSVKLRWSPEMTRFDNWSDRQDGRLVK